MQAKRPALKINMQPSSHINLIIPMISLDPIYDYPKVILFFINNMPLPWNKPSVRIKSVSYMGNQKLVFMITLFNSKYCKNINREHKSNNIYLIVKPYLYGFTQKCTDCTFYESDLIKINHDLFRISDEDKDLPKYKRIRNIYSIR